MASASWTCKGEAGGSGCTGGSGAGAGASDRGTAGDDEALVEADGGDDDVGDDVDSDADDDDGLLGVAGLVTVSSAVGKTLQPAIEATSATVPPIRRSAIADATRIPLPLMLDYA